MTVNDQTAVKAAIWARVSTSGQHTDNQVHVLREWAARRGFQVVAEFVTEDSAWANGTGAKGKEFDRQRRLLVRGAKAGDYGRVLIWSLDRLSRRGIGDTIGVLEELDDAGAVVCSAQQEWLETGDPRMRQLIISVMAWMAEMESGIRSERIKAGLNRRRRDIEEGRIDGRIGGSKKGRKRRSEPQRMVANAGWEGDLGDARRAKLIERNVARAVTSPEERAERAARTAARNLTARQEARRQKILAKLQASAELRQAEREQHA
jgi:DNA invertase Pin-like site-specific DNA recombinase